MSLASKLTLYTACLISGGIIGFVHLKQKEDRDRFHDGVLRDVARQRQKQLEGEYLHNLQPKPDLSKKMEQNQNKAVPTIKPAKKSLKSKKAIDEEEEDTIINMPLD